ncbi:MAG: hypothetical protein J6S21_01515 [Victivallales bacterium]|nr:hypothetical protein [Victivallales bacterium]
MGKRQGKIDASGRRRRRSWWERSLGRFIIALAVVVLLHLPMLLVKDIPEEQPAAESQLPGIGVLPPAEVNGELEAWLRMMSPTQWYYPDEDGGFSQWNLVKREHAVPELPVFTRPPMTVNVPVIAMEPLKPVMEPVESSLRREWSRGEVHFAEVPRAQRPAAPLWRRYGGIQLLNPPELDAEGVAEIARSRSAVTGVTRIEIQPFAGLSAPRVVLRSSCGVPALDQAAIRALRRSLLAAKAGNSGAAVQIEADWL